MQWDVQDPECVSDNSEKPSFTEQGLILTTDTVG